MTTNFVRASGSMVIAHEILECSTFIHICFADSETNELALMSAAFDWAHKQYEETGNDTFINIVIRGGGGDLAIAQQMAKLIERQKGFNRFHLSVAAADLASAGIYYIHLLDNKAFVYGSHATTVCDVVTKHPYTDYDLDMFNIDQNVSEKEHQWVQVATNVAEYYKNRVNGSIDNKVYIKEMHMLFVSMPPYKYAEELVEYKQEHIGSDKWYDELFDLVYVNWCNLIFHQQDVPLPKEAVDAFRQYWTAVTPDCTLVTSYVPKWMAKQASRKRWLPCVNALELAQSFASYILENGQNYHI